jgi:lycopene cyclase domain-containing protein
MQSSSYLVVMALCLVVTLPLEWAFDARVYRRPGRTARALVPVIVVFYLWDVLAISRGHWDFADAYVTGVVLPLGVPLEELVFFIVIPLCALLSYESVRNLLDRRVGWFESLCNRPPATSTDGSGV